MVLLFAAAGAGSRAASAGPRLRLDFGPGYDFTNLVYRSSQPIYVGTVFDSLLHDTSTVFRDSVVLASSPEGAAGVFLRISVSDTVASERFYWLEPELRMARALVTGHVYGAFRWSTGHGLVLGADQRFEHTLDQRFGLSRLYNTETFTGSLGLRSADLSWAVDFRPRVQVEHTGGSAGSFFQDSRGARAEISATHLGMSGALLDLDAYVGTRAYPDSALRDYREGYLGVRWDLPLAGALRGSLVGEAENRWGTDAQSRHDLFSRLHGDAEVRLQPDPWVARARLEADRYDYRNPDETFYDSRLLRAEAGAGRTLGPVEAELRPRYEWFRAPAQPGEDYRQFTLRLGLTRLDGGFADLSLEAGRRHYLTPTVSGAAGDSTVLSTHSDFHMYSASLLLSQPLGRALSLKGSLDYQVEVHDDPTDTNHIVFVGLELGYAFRPGGR